MGSLILHGYTSLSCQTDHDGHSRTTDIIQQIKISLRQFELPVILSGDSINLLSWAVGLAKNIKFTLGVYNGMLVYCVKTTQNYCTEQSQFSSYSTLNCHRSSSRRNMWHFLTMSMPKFLVYK